MLCCENRIFSERETVRIYKIFNVWGKLTVKEKYYFTTMFYDREIIK